MRAEEIQGLMEAYSKVHGTPEVLSEEVVELSDEDLEGIELIEMTMEEVEQLDEAGTPAGLHAKRQRVAAQQQVSKRLGSGGDIKLRDANPLRPNKPFSNPVSGSALPKQSNRAFGTQLGGRQGVVVKNAVGQGRGFAGAADTVNVAGQTLYKAKKGKDIVYLQGKDKPKLFNAQGPKKPEKPKTPPAPAKPGNTGTPPAPAKPGNTGTPTPKPGPSAPKPTKPAGSAMDQWRAANPKLAAAADEKARIRGTSQTDNPLMKDMRSKMSMTPSVQSPTLAKDLGGGSGNQSLINNPNASKAATPKADAPKPTPTPTKTTEKPKDKDKEDLFAHVDIFDLVKGHLLDEGYADTEEGAMVIMVNMSEEWRKSILESHGVEIYAEELEIEEGMSMKDFKTNRKKNERKEASADARSRGHEEPSTGKTYSTDEARSRRSGIHNPEKKPSRDAARDAAGGETGHGGPLRANKVRKARAMGEISEAQRARENPEDHDKEEKRKYEPVRGERTPMPPRGDKRREDFEKWYAKQMGR